MNLADIEWALLNVVRDALAVCGADVDASTMHRYNCAPPMDCCDEVGQLVAWWSSIGPRSGPQDRVRCVTKQQAIINLRFMRCWPCTDDEGTSTPTVAVMDAAAETMTDLAQCALAALLAFACRSTCGDVIVGDVTPVCPRACCSGWAIRLTVAPTFEMPEPPAEPT